MKYLLDTNTFWWAVMTPRELSRRARRICEAQGIERIVSAVSLWELVTKCSIGKLSISQVTSTLPAWVSSLGARVLPLEAAHAYAAYGLPLLHKDPFDRMLVAQAVADDLTLVTCDETIQRYNVKWVW
ncbi:MAG TPA: type II toxin-antitoxin system VapC family toxin [Bryobacteraceae bacterium]|nr:type II toxin-antitoxin system VapC family toxin [Bryobacteraceae bacterium]